MIILFVRCRLVWAVGEVFVRFNMVDPTLEIIDTATTPNNLITHNDWYSGACDKMEEIDPPHRVHHASCTDI